MCHDLLEEYALGNLMEFELLDLYEDNFDIAVYEPFPPNNFVDLRESYYNGGKRYFENFDGFDYLGCSKIIGVEQKFEVEFDRFILRGFIDLVLENSVGEIIIVDHKSKKELKTKADVKHYARQTYLYAKYIKDTYGKYPVKMIFNMFRSGTVLEIPFDMTAYKEAIQWAEDQIQKIAQANLQSLFAW